MASADKLRYVTAKPRVFITSDIGNEPDDAQSLVRYLLYCNEFDTKGIVACTSTHMRRTVHPDHMIAIIKAYGEVRDNLNAHTHPSNPYPSAESLFHLVASGPEAYGSEALEPDFPLSQGSQRLVEALKESPEPLWVLLWGGANTLAQALKHIHETMDADQAAALRARVRIYAISDQDDTGTVVRARYPEIPYICSRHGWNQYAMATWVGISAPLDGADQTKVSPSWVRENIQIGPLGGSYPNAKFLFEGDTPTFLYLIQNGLSAPEHPEWGGWGGRYLRSDFGTASRHYCDAMDSIPIEGNRTVVSNQATIWRWRDAFQNDFAGRMQWTMTDQITKANHAPVVIVNGHGGPEPLVLVVQPEEEVVLDASASYDPDGDEVSFSWYHYREVTEGEQGLMNHQVKQMLPLKSADEAQDQTKATLQVPAPNWSAMDFITGEPLSHGQSYHIILTVKDSGSPSLVSYKRIVIQVENRRLLGGRATAVETTADWLELEGII